MRKRSLGIWLMSLLIAGSLWAQPRAQADLKIRSLNAEMKYGKFTCTLEVHNDNDDDAIKTQLVILLPVGVSEVPSLLKITGGAGTCKASPRLVDKTQSFVFCQFDSIAVRGTRTVQVGTTNPPFAKTCGAFVWSRRPDPDPSNNHRETKLE
ncbi:MAG TPA: hypothetical protein VF179_08265 [Thermoanaerobaculia bacterium]|nr:hypothetical protein [Thermoanaerobaculia bacterium]